MRFNYPVIINVLGLLVMLNGVFMLTCIPFSLYFNEGDFYPILISSVLTIVLGYTTFMVTRNPKTKELKRKDGYLVVTLGWILMTSVGTLPYLFSGAIPNFTDAFFESMSGYTTTGASILTDIEVVGKGILFWRSLTQWIGGMGIIVLAIAILPILGIGGMQLFAAEAPGISTEKLKPRITDTAKRLWYIYVGLTVAETLILWIGGMTFFDAINHSFASMATGGFSTKNASVDFYTSPFIHYVIILFMFLAGTNFTILYLGLHGRIWSIIKDDEFLAYFFTTLIISLFIGLSILSMYHHDWELAFRDSLFQVVSIISTTGFVTADYSIWPASTVVILFIIMFFGASAGSTAGGIKFVRLVILIKNSALEFKRQLHPSAIIPIRLNGNAVQRDMAYSILAFIMIYICIFATGSVLMAALGVDFMTAIGSVATSLSNIGPGLGSVGPVNNFSGIPMAGKWVLSLLMLIGRLELFTVLILFSPYFWKKV